MARFAAYDSMGCRMATRVTAGFATLFMFIACVIIFVCGLGAVNLPFSFNLYAAGRGQPVSGFTSTTGISPTFALCDKYSTPGPGANKTTSCSVGSSPASQMSLVSTGGCGLIAGDDLMVCMPSNEGSEDAATGGYAGVDTCCAPDAQNGFYSGSSLMCKSGACSPSSTTTSGPSSSCVSSTSTSSHGTCAVLSGVRGTGALCYQNDECESGICAAAAGSVVTDKVCQAQSSYTRSYTPPTEKCNQASTVSGFPTATTRSALGGKCTSNNDCTNGKCTTSSSRGTFNGGLAYGYCYDATVLSVAARDKAVGRKIVNAQYNGRLLATSSCFSWSKIQMMSPYVGGGFAHLLMFGLVPIHAFGPTWLRGRHGGWMTLVSVALAVVTYNLYLDFNGMHYDNVNTLIDCSGFENTPEGLSAAVYFKEMNSPAKCYKYNAEIEQEKLIAYFGVNHHTDYIANFYVITVYAFSGGIGCSFLAILLTIFSQLGGIYLQEDIGAAAAGGGGSTTAAVDMSKQQPAVELASGPAQA
jgi:hypothetical protein